MVEFGTVRNFNNMTGMIRIDGLYDRGGGTATATTGSTTEEDKSLFEVGYFLENRWQFQKRKRGCFVRKDTDRSRMVEIFIEVLAVD